MNIQDALPTIGLALDSGRCAGKDVSDLTRDVTKVNSSITTIGSLRACNERALSERSASGGGRRHRDGQFSEMPEVFKASPDSRLDLKQFVEMSPEAFIKMPPGIKWKLSQLLEKPSEPSNVDWSRPADSRKAAIAESLLGLFSGFSRAVSSIYSQPSGVEVKQETAISHLDWHQGCAKNSSASQNPYLRSGSIAAQRHRAPSNALKSLNAEQPSPAVSSSASPVASWLEHASSLSSAMWNKCNDGLNSLASAIAWPPSADAAPGASPPRPRDGGGGRCSEDTVECADTDPYVLPEDGWQIYDADELTISLDEDHRSEADHSVDSAERILASVLGRLEGLDPTEAAQAAALAVRQTHACQCGLLPQYEAILNYWGRVKSEPHVMLFLACRKYIDSHSAEYSDETTNSIELLFGGVEAKYLPVQFDDFRFYMIKDGLDSWLDWEKVRRLKKRPLQLLQAVSQYREQPLPSLNGEEPDFNDLNDYLFDEAALLYATLENKNPFLQMQWPRVANLKTARDHFVSALMSDIKRQRVMDALFLPNEEQPSFHPGMPTAVASHDGFSFKNSAGKSLDDFLDDIEWVEMPEFLTFCDDQASSCYKEREMAASIHAACRNKPWCALIQIALERKLVEVVGRELLEEKFAILGESTQYVIGTPHHSLASTIMRVHAYQGDQTPKRFDSEAQLLKAFEKLEQDWTAKKNYPLHPRLLFALHLAQASGVEFVGSNWRTTLLFDRIAPKFVEVCEQALENGEQAGASAEMTALVDWITTFGAMACMPEEPPSSQCDDSNSITTVGVLKDIARNILGAPSSDQIHWTTVGAGLFPMLTSRKTLLQSSEAVRTLLLDASFRERLIGDDWEARVHAVLRYANERLLATFTSSPAPFDRREAAEEILETHGFSPDSIYKKRHYVRRQLELPLATTKIAALCCCRSFCDGHGRLRAGDLGAVAVDAHQIENDTVVHNAVDRRECGHWVFKDPLPFREHEICGDHDAFALITFGK
jgi:hypothetical protein